MSEKLKFGIVGAGAIAQGYAQAFQECELAEVTAVADLRLESATALAERIRCSAYGTHHLMSQDTKVDAVVVCTPPNTHAEICLDLLKSGIHVLCEKPLSLNSETARTMLAMASEQGVRLTMASKFRYVHDVVKAKSIVSSGALGEIILFENAFTSRVDMSARWNSDSRISGGGVLIDNGTHSVDLMRYFLGPLTEVQVVEGKRVQGLSVEETVRIFVRSVQGVMGSVDLSWSINKELDSYINVYGSDGSMSVGWEESKCRSSSARDWNVFGQGYDKIQALRSQIVNFCRAILYDEPLLITPEDSLASVEVIEAAYAALKCNRWTPVDGLLVGSGITEVPQRSSLST